MQRAKRKVSIFIPHPHPHLSHIWRHNASDVSGVGQVHLCTAAAGGAQVRDESVGRRQETWVGCYLGQATTPSTTACLLHQSLPIRCCSPRPHPSLTTPTCVKTPPFPTGSTPNMGSTGMPLPDVSYSAQQWVGFGVLEGASHTAKATARGLVTTALCLNPPLLASLLRDRACSPLCAALGL